MHCKQWDVGVISTPVSVFTRNMIPSNFVEASQRFCFTKVSRTKKGFIDIYDLHTLIHTYFFSYRIYSIKPFILMVNLVEEILIPWMGLKWVTTMSFCLVSFLWSEFKECLDRFYVPACLLFPFGLVVGRMGTDGKTAEGFLWLPKQSHNASSHHGHLVREIPVCCHHMYVCVISIS